MTNRRLRWAVTLAALELLLGKRFTPETPNGLTANLVENNPGYQNKRDGATGRGKPTISRSRKNHPPIWQGPLTLTI